MNNNYYNLRPNFSQIRNMPNIPYNPNIISNFNIPNRTVGLPRISSLFSGGSKAIGSAGGVGKASLGTASKITFSSILNGTSKTLGVINQAIPIFYQVKPIWNNAKTMFRVVKEINSKDDNNTKQKSTINKQEEQKVQEKKEDNSPTFFI